MRRTWIVALVACWLMLDDAVRAHTILSLLTVDGS